MTARVLAVNVAGATDRLTLGAYYRVVAKRGGYVVVIDNKGDKTTFWATRFTPLGMGTRKEVKA